MYAVFMDYELDGVSNTVVLGGSIDTLEFHSLYFLHHMASGLIGYTARTSIWEVDEDQLPWGYKYQTYYVAAYDDTQRMIGTK